MRRASHSGQLPARRGPVHPFAAVAEPPSTARRGVAAGVAGMAAAIVGTLLPRSIVDYTWIVVALVVGTPIGVPLSRVPLTAVPQRTALSHAFGGLAAALVGTAEVHAVAAAAGS